MKQVLRLAGISLMTAGLFSPLTAQAQAVGTVPQLDLRRVVGSWYEIAKLPNKREKKCVSNGMMLYAMGDKARTFQIVDACSLKDGNTDAQNATGKLLDKNDDGRFKVTYIWPFSTKYSVIALGPDYEWALVGAPNHKSLWVLSRTSTMPPETLAEIEGKAAAQGFDLSKMVMVPQRLKSRALVPSK